MSLKTRVTEAGVIVPKRLLEGMVEVEIERENGTVVIRPAVIRPASTEDPIRQLGERPLTVDVSDASVDHDRYVVKQ